MCHAVQFANGATCHVGGVSWIGPAHRDEHTETLRVCPAISSLSLAGLLQKLATQKRKLRSAEHLTPPSYHVGYAPAFWFTTRLAAGPRFRPAKVVDHGQWQFLGNYGPPRFAETIVIDHDDAGLRRTCTPERCKCVFFLTEIIVELEKRKATLFKYPSCDACSFLTDERRRATVALQRFGQGYAAHDVSYADRLRPVGSELECFPARRTISTAVPTPDLTRVASDAAKSCDS